MFGSPSRLRSPIKSLRKRSSLSALAPSYSYEISSAFRV